MRINVLSINLYILHTLYINILYKFPQSGQKVLFSDLANNDEFRCTEPSQQGGSVHSDPAQSIYKRQVEHTAEEESFQEGKRQQKLQR